MKSIITFALLFLLGFMLGLVLLTNDARAQQQPAPDGTKAQASPTKTEDGPYTITSSIEVGVRGILIDGNANKYRSDLNYTPGFRIFDSSLLLQSKDNDGLLFDKLMVNSFGWGKDPNRSLRVNAEKTKAYKFDANYRRLDYFNSLNNFAFNQHISNTEYRLGDFDLTLLPQNEKFRVNLGYSLSRNSGPSLWTYDYQRDEFPVLAPTRVASDEYRVGFDAKLSIFDISFQQGWRFFKEDTTYLVDQPQIGNNKTNTSAINTFRRDVPTRGETPFTRFSLHTFLAKRLDFTGRFIYTSGKTNYSLVETVTGKDASGNNIVLDTLNVNGNAKRPNGMGDIGVTLFATDKFRISDTFRVNNFRINGGDDLSEALLRTRTTQFGETVLPPLFTDTLAFRTTKYRRYLNLIEGDYDISPRFSLHLGYRYTDRRIELGRLDRILNTTTESEPEVDKFTNQTNTVIFGFKAKPTRRWSLYFDLERGSTDNVFTRIDNYDYTNVRVRNIFRPTKTLTINASVVTKDNTNPSVNQNSQLFGVVAHTRIFSTSADWTPNSKFFISSGYTYTDVKSEAQIIFFLANSTKVNGMSKYFMQNNFAFINTYVELTPRVRLYAGYRINRDPGHVELLPSPNVLTNSYPYQFQSPEAKLSVKLHERVDWIAGYQYFDYKEKFVGNQWYHAHLPYTSLRFYFGRGE